MKEIEWGVWEAEDGSIYEYMDSEGGNGYRMKVAGSVEEYAMLKMIRAEAWSLVAERN